MPKTLPLTSEQESAFESWYTTVSPIDLPDRLAARAAFEAGVRVAENADSIRYEAQYARRFGLGGIGGARDVERKLREGRSGKFDNVSATAASVASVASGNSAVQEMS